MHPFQYQIDNLWELMSRNNKAKREGFYIESLSLTYIIIEIELRLLLTSKVGNKKIPASQIEDQKYLINLANLSKDNGFIDETLYNEIKEFNDFRGKAIHKLAHGIIKYDELGELLSKYLLLDYKIQNVWLPLKIEDVEINDI